MVKTKSYKHEHLIFIPKWQSEINPCMRAQTSKL